MLRLRLLFATLVVLSAHASRGEVTKDRSSAAGYMRIASRPDLQGGNGRLGYWSLYGRLLNEGNWGALELKLDVLQPESTSTRPWANLRARIEGGSILAADAGNGSLLGFRLSQLYVQAGNLLLEDVWWQIGTQDYYLGDLGLYDIRPASVLTDTLGISAWWRKKAFDLIVGVGDAGWSLRGANYSTILSGAAVLRVRPVKGFEFGLGGQVRQEPQVTGDRFAPYATPDIRYEDYVRKEVLKNWVDTNPSRADQFPNPSPTSSSSWTLVGYLGFGGLGPIVWDNLFLSFLKRHPDQSYFETFGGKTQQIFIQGITDERYQLNVGNEMRIAAVPGSLDLAWGVLGGVHWDADNPVAPNDDNRNYLSTVLRAQAYLTESTHLLIETSYAWEHSVNGNVYRNSSTSIFRSRNGASDPRGLEYGDADVRTTWQGKIGPVLSPLGRGIYTRPALRVLYGAQWSSQNNAFGNSFVESLDQFNIFQSEEQHWHHVVSVEAEAWF